MLEHALNYANSFEPPCQTAEIIEILLQIGKISRNELDATVYQRSAGMTTHISVVDSDGRLAGMTSSLGESAGDFYLKVVCCSIITKGRMSIHRDRIQTGERLMTYHNNRSFPRKTLCNGGRDQVEYDQQYFMEYINQSPHGSQ